MHIYDIGASAILVTHPMNENQVILGTEYGDVQLYDIQQEKVVTETSIGKRINAMAYSQNTNNVACAFFGGIDLIDLGDIANILHLSARGNNLTTMVVFQPEFIAIPDDAVFSFDHSTQIWASKAQISRSRTGNSMQVSIQDIDGLDDDGDYSVNKLTFRRKLMDLATSGSKMSPGRQCLSRSGIDIDNPNNFSPSRSRMSNSQDSREVSGILSFEKNGSPKMEHRLVKTPCQIVAPDIANFPSQSTGTIPEQPPEHEDVNEETEIRSTPKRQTSNVTFDLSPKDNITDDRNGEEIQASSDVIDLEPIPKNPADDALSFEVNADAIWKKLDEISSRMDALESKSVEESQTN